MPHTKGKVLPLSTKLGTSATMHRVKLWRKGKLFTMPRFLIITTRTAKFSQEGLDGHNKHLKVLREAGQLELFGPFSDATGGAYLIQALSLAVAEQMAHADPLIEGGGSTCIVKEWQTR